MQCPVNQEVATRLKSKVVNATVSQGLQRLSCCDTAKKVMMPGGLDRRDVTERWAARLHTAAGCRKPYTAPAGQSVSVPDHWTQASSGSYLPHKALASLIAGCKSVIIEYAGCPMV